MFLQHLLTEHALGTRAFVVERRMKNSNPLIVPTADNPLERLNKIKRLPLIVATLTFGALIEQK